MSEENHIHVKGNKENDVLKKSLFKNFLTKKLKTLEMTRVKTTGTCTNPSSNNSETDFYPYQSFPSMNDSQNSISTRSSSSTKNASFFNKLTTKPGQKKRSYRKTQALISKSILNVLPTAFDYYETNSFTSNLEEIQKQISKLYKSEDRVLEMIKKYIVDEQFEQKLLEASSVYFSLQNNAKFQTLILQNDDLLSQAEADKSHQKMLKENLDFLVRQNRCLQEEIENIYRNCEKMSVKFLSRSKNQQAIGRILMKNVVTNNRNLHGKVKAMAEIIQDFETNMSEMQRHVRKVESDKRKLEMDLEKVLETSGSLITEHELEKVFSKRQIETQMEQLEAVNKAGNGLLEELVTYEKQIKNMPFSLNWPKLKLETDEPLEIIQKCKSCVEELVRALITTNTNATILARDANKLRETNVRLQENLRKSTDELDHMRKLSEQSNAFIDDHTFEMEATTKRMETLTEELEQTKAALGEANASIEAMTVEQTCLRSEIEKLLGKISCSTDLACGDVACKLESSREKLEYLYEDYIQLANDKKCLAEKCESLEDANRYLHSDLETYHNQLEALREDFESVNDENGYLKKQLKSDQKTITSLQNERVKYLEEKSILRTIFQHLKVEIARVQELEEALAEMNEETNRLSFIAKYNKELGDKLRSEVEMRESTIQRMKEDMEEIGNINFDSENGLCAQLSEMENVKYQLNEVLEKEMKNSMELDETKKKLEDTTNQKQIFEEIQKHERVALKGLLKNFKNIVRQRDVLMQSLEEINQENLKLKQNFGEQIMTNKNQQHKEMAENTKIKDDAIRHLEKKYKHDISRYQKKLRHLEKHLQNVRKIKDELEKSNEYLKKNAQKLHGDLNEALRKEREAVELFTWKEVEKTSLESELERCRKELECLRHENVENRDVGTDNLENCHVTFKGTDHEPNNETWEQIEELKNEIQNRDEKIVKMEQEFQCVNRQIESQERIMVHYENEICRLSALEKLMKKHDDELEELRTYKEHREICDNYQQSEVPELIEKSVQAERPLQEQDKGDASENVTIGSITMPLCEVIEALQNEKLRYHELSELHEKLKWECKEKEEVYIDEVKLHRDTIQKIADMQDYIKTLEVERDELENKIDMILAQEDDNKARCIELDKENANLHNILDQAKQQYVMLFGKQVMLEAELKNQYNMNVMCQEEGNQIFAQLKQAEVTIEDLKKDLGSNQQSLYHFKEEFYKLQQQVTELEFKNCELTLELHETQAKLETEQRLNDELKEERKAQNASIGSFSSS